MRREVSVRDVPAARAAVIAGLLRGRDLLAAIRAVPASEREQWVDAVLGIDEPPPDEELPRGAVPYLPCAIDDVLAVVEAIAARQPDRATVFVDLGSGLGRVVLLVHLLAGIRTRGIEIQTSLVARARAIASALSLEVELEHADVSAIDLASTAGDDTIYFLYAPFNGELLARVLAQLESVARRRAITVCTVGLPLEVPWLRARAPGAPSSQLALYDSEPRR